MKPRLEDLTPEKTVVVLMDMQEYYMMTHKQRPLRKRIQAQKRVIRKCQEKDIRLILVYVPGGGLIHPQLKELYQRLRENRRAYVKKDSDSTFESEEFLKVINEWNPRNLVFAGIRASACVQVSAEHAKEKEYGIATARNLIHNPPEFLTMDKAGGWYQRNGLYVNEHTEFPLFQ